MERDTLIELLEVYNKYTRCIKNINNTLGTRKKIRMPNFPSEISENIARISYEQKFGIVPSWDIKKGDLTLPDGKRIEVKAFSSKGPTSFGPNEEWDILLFVDCIKSHQFKFKVYMLEISNSDKKWRSMKVSKKHTFGQQCDQKRRPRIRFEKIANQFDLIEIFNDSIKKKSHNIDCDRITDELVKLSIR